MATDNIWESAFELTDYIFLVSSGLDLPRGERWQTLVTVSLNQSNQRLHSIRTLADNGDFDGAVILTRSLFELAVNLSYIDKSTEKRLPQYLKHGGIPITMEEAQQLQEEIDSGTKPAAKDLVPRRAWKPLKDMCCDLGSDWLRDYETIYPYASVPTHAGAFTLVKNYKRLLEGQPPSNWEKAAILTTASSFHLSVSEIAAQTFPAEISIEKVQELRNECNRLGQEMAGL